jgi:adenylosuccinate synthase
MTEEQYFERIQSHKERFSGDYHDFYEYEEKNVPKGNKDLQALYDRVKRGMLNAEESMNNPINEEDRIYQEGVRSALSGVLKNMYEYLHDDSDNEYIRDEW